jgi:hypothetical protein
MYICSADYWLPLVRGRPLAGGMAGGFRGLTRYSRRELISTFPACRLSGIASAFLKAVTLARPWIVRFLESSELLPGARVQDVHSVLRAAGSFEIPDIIG